MASVGRIGLGALGVLALACSESNLGGVPGGVPGQVDLVLPACVQALIASCPLNGTCVEETIDAGAESELHFSSGVRVTFEGELVGTSGDRIVRVDNADGSPCYSFQVTLIGGELFQYVWKDPSGRVVATGKNGSFVEPPAEIECEGGGQTSTCNGNGACCDISGLGNATCGGQPVFLTGTCP